jgi:hypothetical protein
VLVCAPSDVAADIICERLADLAYFTPRTQACDDVLRDFGTSPMTRYVLAAPTAVLVAAEAGVHEAPPAEVQLLGPRPLHLHGPFERGAHVPQSPGTRVHGFPRIHLPIVAQASFGLRVACRWW